MHVVFLLVVRLASVFLLDNSWFSGELLISVEYGLRSVFYCPILFGFILFLKVFHKIFFPPALSLFGET